METKANNMESKGYSKFMRPWLKNELDYFIENLSMLSAGGMTLLSAIDAIGTEVRSNAMRRIIGRVREEVEAGAPLWRALEVTGAFPSYALSLIRIGERAGKLTENLKIIGRQQEKDRMFRSKIKSALLYPLFVLSLTVIVGVGVAWFILPRLANVFRQLRVELPFITKALIAVGNFFANYGVIVVPLCFLVLVASLLVIFSIPKSRRIAQSALFALPGVKRLLKEIELARFGYILGTMLDAGVTLTEALESLKEATTSPRHKAFYLYLRERAEEGNSFEKSFALFTDIRKLIPVPIQQMLVAGERSGALSDTLLKISATYEEKTEVTTRNLVVILEPILLVIIWIGVVAVALAVILPIYRLIGGSGEERIRSLPPVAPPVSAPVVPIPISAPEPIVLPDNEN